MYSTPIVGFLIVCCMFCMANCAPGYNPNAPDIMHVPPPYNDPRFRDREGNMFMPRIAEYQPSFYNSNKRPMNVISDRIADAEDLASWGAERIDNGVREGINSFGNMLPF